MDDDFGYMPFFLNDDFVAEQHVRTLINSVPMQPNISSASVSLTSERVNPFIDAYMKSIKSARDITSTQWSECARDIKNLDMEVHTIVVKVSLQQLKLTI